MQTTYVVISDSEILYASDNEAKVDEFLTNVNDSNYTQLLTDNDMCEEDSTEEDIGELLSSDGYSYGYAYKEEIDIPENYSEDDGIYTESNDFLTYSDILSKLESFKLLEDSCFEDYDL